MSSHSSHNEMWMSGRIELFVLCILTATTTSHDLRFEAEAEDNGNVQRDLRVFNATTLERYESELNRLNHIDLVRLTSRLGKIALYIRLFRRFARSPNVDSITFDRYFPKPEVAFHRQLYDDCVVDLMTCVNTIFTSLKSRVAFMFPRRHQHIDDFIMNADNFRRLLTDSLFDYDVSIAQLFCFLTKRQLSALRQLPFCGYGFSDGNQTWPGDRYKEYAAHSELCAASPDETAEFIDTLSNESGEFSCADRSFCPNPCCGFSAATECPHEICAAAGASRRCFVTADRNMDLVGLVANSWNVSCACDEPGRRFRFDVERCVDIDECVRAVDNTCNASAHEECANTPGSHVCVCALGYIRDPTDARRCITPSIVPRTYEGPALIMKSTSSRLSMHIFSLIIVIVFFLAF